MTVIRDWGWAPEYVDALWRLLRRETPRDYAWATGNPCTLKNFVREVCGALNMDWRQHTDLDPILARPWVPKRICGNPDRILRDLGRRAQCRLPGLAHRLVAVEREAS